MAQDGDTITYTFSGSKETEDISDIDEITIDRMDGADGGGEVDADFDAGDGDGGTGGLVQNATADVSSYSALEIWVGEMGAYAQDVARFGRSLGGASNNAGGGGGSTELWTGSNTVFIAAADAGGGSGGGDNLNTYGGGGGARGGEGANLADDAEGSGFGGDGGSGTGSDGGDGGQELGIASGGTTTTGGSTDGNGEITLSFTVAVPDPPTNVTITDDQTEDELTLNWDDVGAAGYYVYRAESSGSTQSDYTQVADVSGPPYTDTGLEDGEQYFYRVSSHD